MRVRAGKVQLRVLRAEYHTAGPRSSATSECVRSLHSAHPHSVQRFAAATFTRTYVRCVCLCLRVQKLTDEEIAAQQRLEQQQKAEGTSAWNAAGERRCHNMLEHTYSQQSRQQSRLFCLSSRSMQPE